LRLVTFATGQTTPQTTANIKIRALLNLRQSERQLTQPNRPELNVANKTRAAVTEDVVEDHSEAEAEEELHLIMGSRETRCSSWM
jgi:hypothetical protein